ncbi:hypothetical protein [Rhizobium leguminosarum]|uniref:hypothetical protein n=1 Tax=Rhizobium leguminosarum TaxID=384 RepID=UPI00067418FD|nr:hypothetical protein [Rhizobium leguminosarum]
MGQTLPHRAMAGDGTLFGRVPLPRNKTAGRVPPQAATSRLRVLHLLETLVQALILIAVAPCLSAAGRADLARVATRTFTKLYTSLTALDIRTVIIARPQLNLECRVSKAHRNILLGRFAEGKVILAAISRRARPFHSIFYDYKIAKVLRLGLQDNYVLLSHFLSEAIESGRAQSLRKESDALSEDISIGGTG